MLQEFTAQEIANQPELFNTINTDRDGNVTLKSKHPLEFHYANNR